MEGRQAIVAGASGLTGAASVRRLQALGWAVTTLSRRAPEGVDPDNHVTVDLLDPTSCAAAAGRIGKPTHLVYAAVNELPGSRAESWGTPDYAARNGRMFDNLLGLLPEQGRTLAHISLIHGTKAYAPYRPGYLPVPLRESLPRPDGDDFYFRQEDSAWRLAAEAGVGWTVLRAQIVVGGGRSSNLNGLLAIAVLAALRRAAGLNLPLPAAPPAVLEMTDVELLADAVAWSLTAPGARNQIFNVTNGDVFTWRDLWPVIADAIGLPLGEPAPFSVREELAARSGAWAGLVRQHSLAAPADLMDYLGESASLADMALSANRNVVVSTVKIRRAGFDRFVDSAESVVGWIGRWRAEGLLPPR
jgi:nucleoside-diphosphate-sugar epimerase